MKDKRVLIILIFLILASVPLFIPISKTKENVKNDINTNQPKTLKREIILTPTPQIEVSNFEDSFDTSTSEDLKFEETLDDSELNENPLQREPLEDYGANTSVTVYDPTKREFDYKPSPAFSQDDIIDKYKTYRKTFQPQVTYTHPEMYDPITNQLLPQYAELESAMQERGKYRLDKIKKDLMSKEINSMIKSNYNRHWISKNYDGDLIRLEDDSIWLIETYYRLDSYYWQDLDDIIVIENRFGSYPYKLINTEEDEVANAKLLKDGENYLDINEKHSISENYDGEIIELDDDSFWFISSYCDSDSSFWSTYDTVIVFESDDADFPYKLINTDENEVVDAKYLEE